MGKEEFEQRYGVDLARIVKSLNLALPARGWRYPDMSAAALTLYYFEDHLAALTESVETVIPEQEQEFLEDFKAALTSAAEKRDRVAHHLAHLEEQQAFAAKEISRLQKFKKEREAAQVRLEGYVAYCIESQGKDKAGKYRKLEGNTTVMFLRACPASVEVTDLDSLPLDYQSATVTMPASILNDMLHALDEDFREMVLGEMVTTLSADKRAIKAAIEGSVEIPGAKLITDKTTLARK
jgi:Siphovirus Gp157